MKSTPVSVLIPTYNEELNLADCLASVSGWASEIYIIDSFSTDETLNIAKRFGAHILQRAYDNPAQQKNWALDNIEFAFEWVLILDADERVPQVLREEIEGITASGGNGFDGFYLNRRFIFYGKWIKHCGWYPSWNLRLFRHRLGRYEQRDIHEHIILNGSAGYCRRDLIHEDLRDLTHWIAKHNRYASAEAAENYRTVQGAATSGVSPSLIKGPVERKRALKDRILIRLPVPVRSVLFFLYMYFFNLGFLDGIRGFHFCAMHTIFQYFDGIKLWELKHYKHEAPPGGISVKKMFQAPTHTVPKGPEN